MIQLGSGPGCVDAAIALGLTRQVHVRARTDEEAARLDEAGFTPLIEQLHVLQQCRRGYETYSRHQRKSLARHRKISQDIGLKGEVHAGRSLKESDVFNLFIELVCPYLSRRKISPHGFDRYWVFREKIKECLLVIGRDKNGDLVAMDSISIEPCSEWVYPSKSASFSPSTMPTGLVRVFKQGTPGFSRAWNEISGTVLGELGFEWWSLGGDLPFVHPRYAGVIVDKLHWGQAVAWEAASQKARPYINLICDAAEFTAAISPAMDRIEVCWNSAEEALIEEMRNTLQERYGL